MFGFSKLFYLANCLRSIYTDKTKRGNLNRNCVWAIGAGISPWAVLWVLGCYPMFGEIVQKVILRVGFSLSFIFFFPLGHKESVTSPAGYWLPVVGTVWFHRGHLHRDCAPLAWGWSCVTINEDFSSCDIAIVGFTPGHRVPPSVLPWPKKSKLFLWGRGAWIGQRLRHAYCPFLGGCSAGTLSPGLLSLLCK